MKQFYAHYYCKTDYAQDDIVFMKVNKLTSTKTQLPYDYYTMPYCKPNPIVYSAENLGEVLRGDRIENSLYSLEMRNDMQCSVVCKIDSLSEQQTKDFETKIEESIAAHLSFCFRKETNAKNDFPWYTPISAKLVFTSDIFNTFF